MLSLCLNFLEIAKLINFIVSVSIHFTGEFPNHDFLNLLYKPEETMLNLFSI